MRAPLHAGPRAHGPGAAAPDAVAAQLPHGSRGRAGRRQRRLRPAAAGVALRGACAPRRARRWPSAPSRARWSRRITSTACTGCVPARPRRPCCWTASAARRRWRSSCSRPTGRRRSTLSRPGAPSPSSRTGCSRRWTARSAPARCSSTAWSTRSSASPSTWRVSGRSGSSRRPRAWATSRRTSTIRRWGEEALGVLARGGALGRISDLVDVNLLRRRRGDGARAAPGAA